MTPIAHLSEKELARRCKLSIRTLQRWRREGIGPEYLKLGGRVLYRMADIEAWEASCRSNLSSRRQPQL